MPVAHGGQGIDLLIDLHGPDLRGKGGSGPASQEDAIIRGPSSRNRVMATRPAANMSPRIAARGWRSERRG